MTIRQLIADVVAVMDSNNESYTFLHAESDFQNMIADEQLLPCVYLDMPMKYKPIITSTGAYQRNYICTALFLFKSELDDSASQKEAVYLLAENAQREFQLVLDNKTDYVKNFVVGECVQVQNLFDTNMSGIMMPFSLEIINEDSVCI